MHESTHESRHTVAPHATEGDMLGGAAGASSTTRARRRTRAEWRASLSDDTRAQLDAIAQNVRELRSRKHWSQRALALESGVNHGHVAMIERGVENITISTLLRLARALRSTPAALVRRRRRRR